MTKEVATLKASEIQRGKIAKLTYYLSPLPDQVLENVLESVLHFLTSRHDCNAASLVCMSCYRAEALTRTKLFIGNCYAVSPRSTTSRFPRVRSMTIKGEPCFVDFDLMPLKWGPTSPPGSPHSPNITTPPSTNSTSNECPSLTTISPSSPTPSLLSKTSFLTCCEGFVHVE